MVHSIDADDISGTELPEASVNNCDKYQEYIDELLAHIETLEDDVKSLNSKLRKSKASLVHNEATLTYKNIKSDEMVISKKEYYSLTIPF